MTTRNILIVVIVLVVIALVVTNLPSKWFKYCAGWCNEGGGNNYGGSSTSWCCDGWNWIWLEPKYEEGLRKVKKTDIGSGLLRL